MPALFLLVHLISSKGGDGGPVGEQDSWTGEEVEKVVDNHVGRRKRRRRGLGGQMEDRLMMVRGVIKVKMMVRRRRKRSMEVMMAVNMRSRRVTVTLR